LGLKGFVVVVVVVVVVELLGIINPI